MKKTIFSFLFVLFSVSLFYSADVKIKDLPSPYRKWLEEDVVYIITDKEKKVFLKLETDRERNIFIEAFWKQRDPNPTTPENEFKTEHYRRIAYANQWFGKESPGPGWRTDMGRIYIILGEPKSVDKFEYDAEIYPVIIWFYEGMAEYGLPDAFNVVFFKKTGIGEYELYSPIKFGPQQLLIHYKGDPGNYLAAYYELKNIEPQVADISLSLIPGETAFSLSPSMASEILISSKIPSAPQEKVQDLYAEKLLMYKDIVEYEYSANYIDNDSSIKVMRDHSGIFFVNYLVEPKRLSVEKYGKKFFTNLEVFGKVSDLKGNIIYQYEKSTQIEFTEEQMSSVKSKLFSFQDIFPLIEGNYKFNVLLKNAVSKEFTSVEADITVPQISSLQMSSLILASKAERNSKYKGKNKPFLFGDIQLVPSPRNDFFRDENLYIFFQIYGLTDELKENGNLEYSIYNQEKKVHSFTKNIKDYPSAPDFLEEISLANIPYAHYIIKVSLLNENKEEILHEQNNFYISPLNYLPRPWVLSFPLPSSDDPVCLNIIGNQYLNTKNFEMAKTLLEMAYRKNPLSAKYALDFCQVLFALKDYKSVKEVVLPFLEDQEKYVFSAILGQSSQALGELQEAISHYKDYLSHYGTNVNVLNAIGECYYRLGNNEEALVAWEKSLELSPNQERIKKMVESIKEKK
ncbi:MAG: GWxTD domain-containing protein, partial [Candidatus Aminicenantes bacterium]|nr:GWxTD domain-containing protein [Candidatus Aminicenantes bacterium]